MTDPYLLPREPALKFAPGWIGVEPYVIGRHTYISEFTHIGQNTVIGHFTSIGNLCTIGAQKHPMDYLTQFPFEELLGPMEPKATVIGHDVWVGCNAVILAGLTVGDGAVIGAGAVVTKDVPPYAIAVGNPAKVIRYRFQPDIIAGLLETQWWHLPAEEIKRLPLKDPAMCIKVIRQAIIDAGVLGA